MNSNQAEGLVGNKAFTFRILRTGDKSGTNSVQWAVNGSGVNAASATDFSGGILPSGTVNFTPGQSSQLISVNVSGDTIVEASESFQVVLSLPTNGATLGAATASGVIINDDGTLAIAPVNADRDEGASGARRFLFTVTRTGTLSRAHAATWSVTGSGAHPARATDFAGGVLPSGEVRFAPGQRIDQHW